MKDNLNDKAPFQTCLHEIGIGAFNGKGVLEASFSSSAS